MQNFKPIKPKEPRKVIKPNETIQKITIDNNDSFYPLNISSKYKIYVSGVTNYESISEIEISYLNTSDSDIPNPFLEDETKVYQKAMEKYNQELKEWKNTEADSKKAAKALRKQEYLKLKKEFANED